jgi:hypothetical protein
MWSLAETLNSGLGDAALEPHILQRTFDAFWQAFETDFNATLTATVPGDPPPVRETGEVLDEILQSTRSLSQRMSNMERVVQLPRPTSVGIDFGVPMGTSFLTDQARRDPWSSALLTSAPSSGLGLSAALAASPPGGIGYRLSLSFTTT